MIFQVVCGGIYGGIWLLWQCNSGLSEAPQPGYTADGWVIHYAQSGRAVVQEEDDRLSLCTARDMGGCQLLMLLSLHLEWGALKQMAGGSCEQLMIWVTAQSLGLLLEVGIHLAKDFLR